jgi:hypothetical protein
MNPEQRQRILDSAIRTFGAEVFNRLVEKVHECVQLGRLRFWQEELLSRLLIDGIAIGFAEYLEVFSGVTLLPVPKPPRGPVPKHARKPASTKEHPILGEIQYDAEEKTWAGPLPLPTLALYGQPILDEYLQRMPDDFREDAEWFRQGRFLVVIHAKKKGPTPEQDAALRHLVDNEVTVCRQVLEQLVTERGVDLQALKTYVWCTQVEVADRQMSGGYLDGLAYLGFIFSFGFFEECPICVVYHPSRNSWWAEATLNEALALADD